MYCAVEDIKSLVSESKLKKLLDISDTLNDEHIQPFIDIADGMIESKLGAFYRLPITGLNALKIVRMLSVKLTIVEIFTLNEDGELPERIKDYREWALKELDAYGASDFVEKPVKFLPDARSALKAKVAV